MFAFKVITYYLAALCILAPIFTFMFWNNHPEEEKESRPKFPVNAMRRLFIFGVALLTGATIMTLLG